MSGTPAEPVSSEPGAGWNRVNVDDYRSFMAGFPTGVAITAALDARDQPCGMTSTSLCSVTLNPPTLLVSLRFGLTLSSALETGRFALNLLAHGSQHVADLFASKEPDRFLQVDWQLPLDAAGPHLVKNTHSAADCTIVAANKVGDHTVLYGQVYQVTNYASPMPLLYGLRRYSRWAESPADVANGGSAPPPEGV